MALDLTTHRLHPHVKQLKKRITTLEIEFQKNCNEEAGFMLFTKEVCPAYSGVFTLPRCLP